MVCTWATGHDTDLVDFANFLGELNWPIENRYIVLFNEVNRSTEWGGDVDPEKYASIIKNAPKTIANNNNNNQYPGKQHTVLSLYFFTLYF